MKKLFSKKPALVKNSGASSRRDFIVKAGLGLSLTGMAFTLAACGDDDDGITGGGGGGTGGGGTGGTAVDFGSGDVGILNYAYALEQLEAAFYTQVITSSSFGTMFNADEQQILTDLYNHEVIHREFFKAGLGDAAIPALEVNFSAINFNDRDSILETAQTFEDLGVSAYNGAGRLLTDANNLTVAGKIVSVEARHAAAIRSVFQDDAKAFASTTDENGLDPARTPSEVLTLAAPFITTEINADNLPTG